MKFNLLSLVILICFTYNAYSEPQSAKRNTDQSWKSLAYPSGGSFSSTQQQTPPSNLSALTSAVRWKDIDLSLINVDEKINSETSEDLFYFIRDHQFIDDQKEYSPFLRRISWLYPDDGCFVRAAMMSSLFIKSGYESPQRVFVFGDLSVKTENSRHGKVSWWYHTALISKVDGKAIVWDPALESNYPLPLKDWLSIQNDDISTLKVAICSSGTYGPRHNCINKDLTETDTDKHLPSQIKFLNSEWKRQISLRRDPLLVLGDSPPWSTESDRP